MINSLDSHNDLCRSLCHQFSIVVVSVDYRQPPEHTIRQRCRTVTPLCSGAQPQAEFGDGIRLAVAGDSAGGNLAAALALYARDRGSWPLRLQVLI